MRINQRRQILTRDARKHLSYELYTIDLNRFCATVVRATRHRQLAAQLRHFIGQRLALIHQRFHPCRHISGRRFQLKRKFRHAGILRTQIVKRGLARERFNSAYTRTRCRIPEHHKQPNITCLAHMRATT